ncbi:hypothetical protein [Psychrobacter sp. AOP7-B1-24]|uniref:hypothetical protein n=1 Tax=Psychrobacter sp. AOP7-B1-24 TaxID=3457645 RepID=UPI00402B9C19
MNYFNSHSPTAKFFYRIVPVAFFSVLLLAACQKGSEPESDNDTQTETAVQTTPVTTNINAPDTGADADANLDNNTDNTTAQPTDANSDISLEQLEGDVEANNSAPPTTEVKPNPEQAIKGTQITDVRYENATGETLSVIFETSAEGTLNAIVTMPNKPKMTLSAPEGQGNNPTYRSTDGSLELVSHAGGGTIDLVQNNKVTSFDAVSAEAEVVTE